MKKRLIVLSVIAAIAVMFYVTAETILDKLLVLYISLFIVVPIVLRYFYFLLMSKITPKKSNKKKTYSKNYSKTNLPKNSCNNSKNTKKKYKHKEVNNPFYLQLRDNLIIAMKNKALNRMDVLSFLESLNKELGSYASVYNDMSFKNDMHQIYSKLKSSKLTDENYKHLLNKLNILITKEQ